jgi:threonine/homoserine/homoserine lactone efflux protein
MIGMSLETWLLFCLTEAVLCVTPGPAVLLVVSVSLSRGAAAGFRASLGILAANTMYFAISATSLGALLLASWELFTVVKWAGAVYLIWRGLQMLWPGRASVLDTPEAGKPLNDRMGAFPYGFLTQGANPKALVFFTAILPQFVDARGPIGLQLLILGLTSIVIELAVLSLYVMACQQARGLSKNARFAAPLERTCGILLIGAGARLALTQRG